MPKPLLSQAARRFLRDKIESIGHLEVLLLVYGHASVDWTAERVAATRLTSEGWAQARLESLASSGLLDRIDVATQRLYRVAALSPAEQLVMDELARVDLDGNRMAMLELIYSR